jgi:hypothetical protein
MMPVGKDPLAANANARSPEQSLQNKNFKPNCKMRAGLAEVTTPNWLELISPVGFENCAWLNRLNASMRN